MGTPADPLSDAMLQAVLLSLPDWHYCQHEKRDALCATYQFNNFTSAMAFMQAVAPQAEALQHHPEWTNVYNRMVIRLTTHDAGNKVTMLDINLACCISTAAALHGGQCVPAPV